MKKYLILFGLVASLFNITYAEEVIITTSSGEMFVLQLDLSTNLAELQEKVKKLSNCGDAQFTLEFSDEADLKSWGLKSCARGGPLGHPRIYENELTAAENSDIRYIVTTLANRSLITLAIEKGDLEAAGDRLEHVHPLRFLIPVFTDEELKVGIRNIRGRGWIWGHFGGGIKEALASESSIGNLKDEHILDFAKKVKIDPALILPALHGQHWEEFIDLLIAHIPRVGDHDRYDN